MRFSWTGLILAPLLVPTLFSVAMLSLQEGNGALLFLILMVPSCILAFFLRWAADPFNAIYPLAGLMTSGFYWWLVARRSGRPSPQ